MPRTARSLGAHLFLGIEAAQGRAFISDGIVGLDDATIMRITGGALAEHRKCVHILREFLRHHNAEAGICQRKTT